MEAPYEIWLWLAKRFLRRRCLKSVDDGQRQMDNGACLIYKLTYEPKGSGELIKNNQSTETTKITCSHFYNLSVCANINVELFTNMYM